MICCSSCSAELSRRIHQKVAAGKSISGLCGKCWRASIRNDRNCCECDAKLANRYAVRCRPCSNRRLAKDEAREARRLSLAAEARKRPDVQLRRKIANRLAADRKLAWCPPERRAEYFKLLRLFGTRAEAKRIIEADMTPLERQVSRVMSGARVVAKIKAPANEPTFTLGGVVGVIV